MQGLEREIVQLIAEKGPCTGLDIRKAVDVDSLVLWKTCKTSPQMQVRTVGRRYLRLDRHVEGFARLSPSILREFLTYSVIGLPDDPQALENSAAGLMARIRTISDLKLEFARQMISSILFEYTAGAPLGHEICFIIAGDIVYNMAHQVPRPERSTGRLVKGSDIDLVVVVEDDFPDALIDRLDKIIYQRKYRVLIDPQVNEEVDYKIKRFSLIKEQAAFDTFPRMVAIKILQEGVFLEGSSALFHSVKALIEDRGLLARLEDLEGLAMTFREKAERSILDSSLDREAVEKMHLFYSAEEFEEFE